MRKITKKLKFNKDQQIIKIMQEVGVELKKFKKLILEKKPLLRKLSSVRVKYEIQNNLYENLMKSREQGEGILIRFINKQNYIAAKIDILIFFKNHKLSISSKVSFHSALLNEISPANKLIYPFNFH